MPYIVLGFPSEFDGTDKTTWGIRRPVVFEPTSQGWLSHSNVPGWRNNYVSNETWSEIMKWVHQDMVRPQIFSSHQDWQEYHEQNKVENPNWDQYLKSSSYYKKSGLSLDEEVERLLYHTKVTFEFDEPSEIDEMEEP